MNQPFIIIRKLVDYGKTYGFRMRALSVIPFTMKAWTTYLENRPEGHSVNVEFLDPNKLRTGSIDLGIPKMPDSW